jgi:hypothetical protein
MVEITAILGFILLVAGHQLYWLFVGGVGFIAGGLVANQLQIAQSPWELLTFSMATGVLGILLGFYLKKWAVALAAALSGVYIIQSITEVFGWSAGLQSWPILLAVALIFAVLVVVWFDWAVILISTLSGTVLVVRNVQIAAVGPGAIVLVLVLIGLSAQFILSQYSRPEIS